MKYFITLSILMGFFFTASLEAAAPAVLSFSTPSSITMGAPFSVDVILATGGQTINTASVNFRFDKEMLTFEGYKDEAGTIQLWLQHPTEEPSGQVRFSGIIPGGADRAYDPIHTEREGLILARLLFKAVQPGSAQFSVEHSEVLLHDGKGTLLAHTNNSHIISIKQNAALAEGGVEDTEKPLPFSVLYEENPVLSRTPSLIAFQAKDIGTGVAHYEAKLGLGAWKQVTSPITVSPRVFPTKVHIRAYDYAGNFQVATAKIPGNPLLTVLALLGALVAVWIVRFMLKIKV